MEEVNLHLGKRLHRRRRMLGLTQHQVAVRVGVRFQQIQKYECGASSIGASRLYSLAQALDVPITYFYDGLSGEGAPVASAWIGSAEAGATEETQDLVEAYRRLDRKPRRMFLALARSLEPQPAGGD
jgi:transcriptional regulator with XRE-family HTH domain